jgi:sugar phosphate permease
VAGLHLRTLSLREILSRHFEKGLVFSLWTGSSQFGDFIALMVSYLLVEEAKFNPGVFLIVIALLLVGMYYLNRRALPNEAGA